MCKHENLKMKGFFILSFLVLSIFCFSQSLLVNGGFEDENICTEYKVNCAPEAWIANDNGFNNYFKGANRAYEGTHYMAVEAGHAIKPYQRTFICSQLLCSLKKAINIAWNFLSNRRKLYWTA